MHPEEILIPIAFFASVVIVLYLWISTRHRERMALIENGLVPDQTSFAQHHQKSIAKWPLKIGLLFMGIALGIIAGAIIDSWRIAEEEVGYFSMIFLFGGAGLMTYYRIAKKEEEEEKRLDL